MMKSYEVAIDQEGCIGCGLCVTTCPEVFSMHADGYAEVAGAADEHNIADVRSAAQVCPVSVIHVEE